MSLIPRPELDALVAADLALAGEPADGYQALLGGLARAREFEGEPWTEEPVRQWKAAVERWGIERA